MDNNRCFSGGREVASLFFFIGDPSVSSTALVSETVVDELDEDAVIIDDEVAVAAPRTDNELLCNAAMEFDKLDDEEELYGNDDSIESISLIGT